MELKKIILLGTLAATTIFGAGHRVIREEISQGDLTIKYSQKDFFGFFRKVEIEEITSKGKIKFIDSNNPHYLTRGIFSYPEIQIGDGTLESYRLYGKVCLSEEDIVEKWEEYRDDAACFFYYHYFRNFPYCNQRNLELS